MTSTRLEVLLIATIRRNGTNNANGVVGVGQALP